MDLIKHPNGTELKILDLRDSCVILAKLATISISIPLNYIQLNEIIRKLEEVRVKITPVDIKRFETKPEMRSRIKDKYGDKNDI